MAQNRFFSDAIKREAIKARANAHHHNCLPGKDIVLKSTYTFLTSSCELYRAILRAFLRVGISDVENFLSSLSASSLTCIARPVNLISLQPLGSKRFKSFSDNELDCFCGKIE